MASLYELTAHEAAERMARREISSRELTDAILARIEAVDPQVRAFLSVTPDEARRQADAVDAKRMAGDLLPPLAGIPIALKDTSAPRGHAPPPAPKFCTTSCPLMMPPSWRRLREAGLIFVGKTNLDEFAMGSSTENSGFHTSRNPWDRERVPGGSSGGSAAAVAALEAPLALGSDTGGSIRQPASLCGIVGLKPTYGRVSRYGLIAYASSLDQIGPLTRDVRDAALLLQAIAGPDPHDSTCTTVPTQDYLAACGLPVKGLRIGVPKEYFGQGVTAPVAATVRAAIEALTRLGATAEECSLPYTEYALAAYYILAPAECSSNLARFDGVRYGLRTKAMAGHIGLIEKTRDEGFGDEVKQRIMIGTYALSAGYYDAYYRRAQQVRTLIRRDFDRAFETFDLLLTPTAPSTAFKIGEKADPMEMKLADVCTLPVNMAGLPGISLPCGFVEGLPVGLQLIGKPFEEATLLRAAHAYEQATEWHRQRPIF